MPRPFVAYLRVYEPLSAFDDDTASSLRAVIDAGPIDRDFVGMRERELWLRAQLATPARLLPGETVDGRAVTTPPDALVISPNEVPGMTPASHDSLVCPLELRPRAAAALVGFLATSSTALSKEAIGLPPEIVRSRATSAMGELTRGAVHTVSTTWTVPLPWFAMVDPDQRRIVLANRDDPARQVSWRTKMSDALARLNRARTVVAESIGENGPARILADTLRWLDHFHADSAVELDYGGLVQLVDDDALLADESAEDVHAIVDALEAGDTDEVDRRYRRLREFWGELAAHEWNN
ncbi:MAG: hypothetical protein J2O49_03000 [Sciscionella sp.]|nr:hypothetical protein [Sciscionella sp.]